MTSEGQPAATRLGRNLALPRRMARDQEHRGKVPEIRTNQDTITFVLTIAVQEGTTAKLVLRCERDGGLFASIRPAFLGESD